MWGIPMVIQVLSKGPTLSKNSASPPCSYFHTCVHSPSLFKLLDIFLKFRIAFLSIQLRARSNSTLHKHFEDQTAGQENIITFSYLTPQSSKMVSSVAASSFCVDELYWWPTQGRAVHWMMSYHYLAHQTWLLNATEGKWGQLKPLC